MKKCGQRAIIKHNLQPYIFYLLYVSKVKKTGKGKVMYLNVIRTLAWGYSSIVVIVLACQ